MPEQGPGASDIKLHTEPLREHSPPRVASREAQEVGVAGHVVGAQPFLDDDGVWVALEESPETFFQVIRRPNYAGAGQFGNRQVEQMVDIPVQFLLAGGLEVPISHADGTKSTKHFAAEFVRFLPAASGGVTDKPVGQRRGAFLRHRRPDVDVLSGGKL